MTEEKDEFEKLKNKLKDLSKITRDNEYKQCSDGLNNALEVFEIYEPKLKAQILKDNPMAGLTDADIHNLLDVLNWLKYDDVEKTTNARLKLKRELSRREEKKED